MKKIIKNKKESLVLGKVLRKVAPRIGATVLMEPEWGIAGRITFKSGQHSYFFYSTLDLNPVGGSAIARDKDYSNFFIATLGYPVVPGSRTFYSDSWGKAIGAPERNIAAAYDYARSLGLPVIVKPNSGTQGVGVALVHNKREFYRALRAIFKRDSVVLVQQAVVGKDYRIVVLDEAVISAYERTPLCVVGNGRSTVARLLALKQQQFILDKRDTQIREDDPRIIHKLAHQGLTLTSVLRRGQKVFLLDNANLSTGGDSRDVTGVIHQDFVKIAVELTRGMGLRLCGVDVMVAGDISEPPLVYWVLEINSSPGLDHYVTIGKAQEKIVEDLYFKILKQIER